MADYQANPCANMVGIKRILVHQRSIITHFSRRTLLFALGATMLTLLRSVLARRSPSPGHAAGAVCRDERHLHAVYEAGTGPTFVLLHGFAELAYSWHNQIPALVEAGYRVIVPDLRGYGLTERPRW